ncbi:bacteriocin immunity protein [Lactobacillus intestinalis]|uniref:bacteriocin immunity protein n=1 Tax=Lactobacillus intestinalis TaxID=151781 RepID=UPI0012B71D63|nr:bacteriocin immunity protein [Lactobacillus intestinalis]MDE7056812.1 bacteriocin immunity protein [Lactobacillus sp.]
MRETEMGVGMHNNTYAANNEFIIKVRSLVNSDPDLIGNEDIMKIVKLALYKASKDEPRAEVAKELDDELSVYLAKNKFKAPKGVRKLQEELKKYTVEF